MNFCPTCQRDFGSVRSFDAHRTGKHDRAWPSDPDGRRCLDEPELLANGFERNSHGRWSLTRDLRRAEDFKPAPLTTGVDA